MSIAKYSTKCIVYMWVGHVLIKQTPISKAFLWGIKIQYLTQNSLTKNFKNVLGMN